MSDDRPVQYFTDAYLEHCRSMTAEQIAEYLEDYRQIAGAARSLPRKAISIRIEQPLLRAFKQKAKSRGVPYQTQIQRLMKEWLLDGES